jgi:septin 7
MIASNGASPIAPTRASPSPPALDGSPLMDRSFSPMANGSASPAPQTVSSTDPKLAVQLANEKNIVRRKLTGYVGFANLPNQWHRKSVRKGFNFNVMVVGMYTLGDVSRASAKHMHR